MKKMDITAKLKDGPTETVNFVFPENLDELVETYTEEVVFQHARAALIVALQGFMRGKMTAEVPATHEELQIAVDEWKPGTRRPGVSKVERIKDTIAKMTPEQKAALMAEIEAMGNGDEPEPDEEEAPARPAPAIRRGAAARPAAEQPTAAPARNTRRQR